MSTPSTSKQERKKLLLDMLIEHFGEANWRINWDDRMLFIYIDDNQLVDIVTEGAALRFKGWGYSSDQIVIHSTDAFLEVCTLKMAEIKEMLEAYFKSGRINQLPPKLSGIEQIVYDLSSITCEVVKKLVEDAAMEHSNGQVVDQITMIPGADKVVFSFVIDAHRYGMWKNNEIIVNNRGAVTVDFNEGTGLEGIGADDDIIYGIGEALKEANPEL